MLYTRGAGSARELTWAAFCARSRQRDRLTVAARPSPHECTTTLAPPHKAGLFLVPSLTRPPNQAPRRRVDPVGFTIPAGSTRDPTGASCDRRTPMLARRLGRSPGLSFRG